jgi:translation initiation factor 6
MATRCAFENSDEVGVFAALTNAYCLTGKEKDKSKGDVLPAICADFLFEFSFLLVN